MPGLEDSRSRLNPVSGSDLVTPASPVVQPNAVAALSDAFRNGFVTADDVLSRASALAKKKEKAQVMALDETMAPEAVALRGLQQQAAGAQAQQQIDIAALQEVYRKYPAAEYFDKHAPALGLARPTLPDGTPDFAKMAQIGSRIAKWQTDKTLALQERGNIDTEKSADGTVLFARTKQGLPVDLKQVQRLDSIIAEPFQEMEPGRVSVQPKPAAAAPLPNVPTGTLYGAQAQAAADFAQKTSELSPEDTARVAAADAAARAEQPVTPLASAPPVVQPAPAAPAAPLPHPPIGTPVPGASGVTGISLGPPKAKDKGEKPIPSEGVEKLALAQQAMSIAKNLENSYNRLVANTPEFTGLISGTITKAAAGQRWNQQIAEFEREATAILAPLAKGTYNETGVLSDKDVERYKNVIPDLRDNPKIGASKIQSLLKEVTNSYSNKLKTWEKAGYDVTGFASDMTSPATPVAPAAQPAAAPSQGTGKVITLSNGKRFQRGADGQLYQVQ